MQDPARYFVFEKIRTLEIILNDVLTIYIVLAIQ